MTNEKQEHSESKPKPSEAFLRILKEVTFVIITSGMYYKLYTNLDVQGGLPLMQVAEQGAKIYVPEGSVLIDRSYFSFVMLAVLNI